MSTAADVLTACLYVVQEFTATMQKPDLTDAELQVGLLVLAYPYACLRMPMAQS